MATSAGKDMGKEDPSYTVGVIANRYNHSAVNVETLQKS